MGNLAACSKPCSKKRIIAYVLLGWSSLAHACSSVVGGWGIEKLGRISLQLRLERCRLRLARNRTGDATSADCFATGTVQTGVESLFTKSYDLGKLLVKRVPLPKQILVRRSNHKIDVTNVVAHLMEVSIQCARGVDYRPCFPVETLWKLELLEEEAKVGLARPLAS
jgi:hypothetical protein